MSQLYTKTERHQQELARHGACIVFIWAVCKWAVCKWAVCKWASRGFSWACLLLMMFCAVSATSAQDTERIITLKNFAQFEGLINSVNGFPAGEILPYRNDPVVMIDDGLRRIFVSNKQLAQNNPSERIDLKLKTWQRVYQGSDGFGAIVSVGPFDKNGHRLLRVRTDDGFESYVQGITLVTPRYCKLETLVVPRSLPGVDLRMRNWEMSIATSTVPADVLRDLLRKQIKNPKQPSEYFEIVDFFIKSEQYRRAIEELRFVQQKFPELEADLAKERIGLRQSHARKVLREVNSMISVGQRKLAMSLASVFSEGVNREGLAGEILAEFNEVKNQQRQIEKSVDQLRTLVAQSVASAKTDANLDQPQQEMLDRFVNEIETELDAGTLTRLDAFRRFSTDGSMSALEKVALAISGWFTGTNNAIGNFAVVQTYYPVRDLVIEYLTDAGSVRRKAILDELKKFEGGEPEIIAQMLPLLKPLFPLGGLDDYTGEKPLEFFVEIPGVGPEPKARKIRCLAHLPPEYKSNPYRKYPCMLTLRPSIDMEQQLNRFCGSYSEKLGVRTGPAMKAGFVVVAVDWQIDGIREYRFSASEHAAIMRAFRATLRSFSVDTDRVFLQGHGEGATAAFDIALSHPEHWAGVMAVGGRIIKYSKLYQENRHVNLPIYSVVGQKHRQSVVDSKDAWNTWLRTDRYLDCILVEYQGRGDEPFHEELPSMMEWTRTVRRIRPDKSGFEIEFKTRRPWDNYFWFWEFKGIPEQFIHRPEHWTPKHPSPMKISATLKDNQPNTFILGPKNMGAGGILWLSPEFVDFKDEIRVSGRGAFKGYVKPSRRVILEDVRRRADRQHPYWAQINCVGKNWQIQP